MKTGDLRRGIGCAIAGLAYPIIGILGLIIHVWTILIAFISKGLFAAVLSLIFPVLAQIYWGLAIWHTTGTITNYYCLALIGYVILSIMIVIGLGMAES